MPTMQARHADPAGPSATVVEYHERTKHHLERYAAGPATLDWDAAPAAFRSFTHTECTSLPLLAELPEQHPARTALESSFAWPASRKPQPWALTQLGVWLQCSLGITAWKTYGPDRWAVRANPSSGNLHPIEAYVLSIGVDGLADGVHHYDAQSHALSLRAALASATRSASPMLAIALTNVMWREAWKYGERAFRYCQLDTGHAIAALGVAASALGASLSPCKVLRADELAAWLGVDRLQDFPAATAQYTELEEPEGLWQVHAPTLSNEPIEQHFALDALQFRGTATRIDARPMYAWPSITQVAVATRLTKPASTGATEATPTQAVPPFISQRSFREVLLGRRSAQRFDPHYELDADSFFGVLQATLPSADAPWAALPSAAALDLVLLVHRVQSLEPGLYLFTRGAARSRQLRERLRASHTLAPVERLGAPDGLYKLSAAEPKQLMRVARALHCHQDIASNSCFVLGMLTDLEHALRAGPHAYRSLHWEAGAIGQQLYLAAEARALRATGIGCFFDDAFHKLLGLSDAGFQSLYHFTFGRAIEDSRIESSPPYPGRRA